jgi:pimeloyl-ACP methyl ester carboxylesterase
MRTFGFFLLGAVLGVLLLSSPGRADLVYLFDGFTLQGKIVRESTNYVDPQSGQQITMARLNGFFMIDDGARRIIFSQNQVQEVDDRSVHLAGDYVTLRRYRSEPGNFLRYPIVHVADVTPFDRRWERNMIVEAVVQGDMRRLTVPQRLVELNPYFARLDGREKYNIKTYYLTQEFGPDMVQKLLATHPDTEDKGQTGDAIRRWRRFRFFVQAGWYDTAQKELDGIRKNRPDQKDKIEQAQTHLQSLRAQRLYDDIDLANRAGRHRWAQQQLADFPTKDTDDRLQSAVRSLKSRYELANLQIGEARRFLDTLPGQIADPALRDAFAEAIKTIRANLGYDNADRLDAFIRFAQQAERLTKQGQKPKESPEQIVALALSGWLLGSSSAQLDVAFAQRLWQTRQFVLDYQKTAKANARQTQRDAYVRGQALAFDEMAQLIRYLPPPDPENPLLPPGAELQTDLPGQTQSVRYLVQLPPEFTHSRPYPVLLVLHQTGQKPLDMLTRWSYLAAKHGYILVAPEWEAGLGSGYNYTAEDQGAVLAVMRDLRRRFPVDSDRVFLYGYGDGGVVAYDVGLGHPDQFAGLVLMCTRPRYFARKYWPNAQYLPLYIADGDRDSENPSTTRTEFEHWVPRGYPALYVEYKGRGADWYPAELQFVFDWMDRKKRAAGFPELGKAGSVGPSGEEFQSLRACDNRFYWLSSDNIDPHHLNDASHWSQNMQPAMFQARIGESNSIQVNVRGVHQVTVWLGSGMVDFNKPVQIQVILPGQRGVAVNRLIKPDLGTLLEDFHERGDRQRIFWARVEFNNLR